MSGATWAAAARQLAESYRTAAAVTDSMVDAYERADAALTDDFEWVISALAVRDSMTAVIDNLTVSRGALDAALPEPYRSDGGAA